MGPERALKVADLVHKYSGFKMIGVEDPRSLYEAILNPSVVIHYIAACNRTSIDVYKKYANFDISKNVGLIATLYNIGREEDHANLLKQRNMKSIQENGIAHYPEVNYYGWFINSKESELRTYYRDAVRRAGCK